MDGKISSQPLKFAFSNQFWSFLLSKTFQGRLKFAYSATCILEASWKW